MAAAERRRGRTNAADWLGDRGACAFVREGPADAIQSCAMGDPKTVLLALLVLLSAAFVLAWGLALRGAADQGDEPVAPTTTSLAVGAVTNFFDTLGVGSFAPTTWIFRTMGIVPDRLLPGTLNVGHALPSVAQALVFIAIVTVEARTLVLMVSAAVIDRKSTRL